MKEAAKLKRLLRRQASWQNFRGMFDQQKRYETGGYRCPGSRKK